MDITLEQVAKAIEGLGALTDMPTFGSASVEIQPDGLKVNKAEIVWGGYIDIQHPRFIYNIAFGEADGGWSYNDDQGYGYCGFIPATDYTTPERIANEFFLQVFNNPQLSK